MSTGRTGRRLISFRAFGTSATSSYCLSAAADGSPTTVTLPVRSTPPLILAPARWWSDNNCRGLVSVAVNRFNWADACACTPFRRWIALSFVRALSMSKQRSRTSMSLPIFHYQCGNCGTRKCARSGHCGREFDAMQDRAALRSENR